MNNTTTSQSDATIIHVRLGFFIAAFVIGMVGNILVIVILGKKNKRTIHEMFILNLAVSDLTFLLFLLPINTYELYRTILKNEIYCRFVFLMQTISYFISIFTITSMAIHRCYVIVNSYKRVKMKSRTGHIWIGLIWFVSLVIVSPIAVVNQEVDGQCKEKWFDPYHAKIYTAVLFVLQFLLPLTIIAIAYLKIGVFLVKQKGPQTSLGTNKEAVVNIRKRKENKQIIRTLAAIVALFTICLLPGQIAWMVRDFGTPHQAVKIQVIFKFADILDVIHACVNPIIYGLLTDKFRKEYKDLLTGLVSCGKIKITNDHMQETSSTTREGNANDVNLPSTAIPSLEADINTRASIYTVPDTGQVDYRF